MSNEIENDLKFDQIRENLIPQILSLQTDCGLSPWTEADYREEIHRDDTINLAATIGDKVIGFIVLRLLITEGEIYNIAVSREFRKIGIGKRLLDETLRRVVLHKNINQIWLEVRVSNEKAILFYKKNGFVVAGQRKNFYSNPTENALLMKLVLRV